MNIQIVLLYLLFSSPCLFSQEAEKHAHVALHIRNEKGEIYKGGILLIANNDTIPVTKSHMDLFLADLLPGTYRLVLQGKLFEDYVINSLQVTANETKKLEIVWKHKTLIIPEVLVPVCTRY